MANSTRLFKSFFRLLFPVVLIIAAVTAGFSVWLVYKTSRPLTSAYLITPEKFGQLSSRAAQITDESWTNRDGSGARGWLLRGAENAPAVILFHKYGADRSYVLNLGVKLNESTNFTVLMPDLRAHGNDPKMKICSFGRLRDRRCDGCDRVCSRIENSQSNIVGKQGYRPLRCRIRLIVSLERGGKGPVGQSSGDFIRFSDNGSVYRKVRFYAEFLFASNNHQNSPAGQHIDIFSMAVRIRSFCARSADQDRRYFSLPESIRRHFRIRQGNLLNALLSAIRSNKSLTSARPASTSSMLRPNKANHMISVCDRFLQSFSSELDIKFFLAMPVGLRRRVDICTFFHLIDHFS